MQTRYFIAAVCLLGCANNGSRHAEHAGSHHDNGLLAAFVDLAVDAAFDSIANGGGGGDAPAAEGETVPDHLDHDMAAYGLVDAMPALQQCETAAPIPMTVTVRPNGDIERVNVQATPASQSCVQLALGGVEFPRTLRGGKFHWNVPAAPPPPPPQTPPAPVEPAAAAS